MLFATIKSAIRLAVMHQNPTNFLCVTIRLVKNSPATRPLRLIFRFIFVSHLIHLWANSQWRDWRIYGAFNVVFVGFMSGFQIIGLRHLFRAFQLFPPCNITIIEAFMHFQPAWTTYNQWLRGTLWSFLGASECFLPCQTTPPWKIYGLWGGEPALYPHQI